MIYEKDYEGDIRRLRTTKVEYYFKRVSIKEYAEIKFDGDNRL